MNLKNSVAVITGGASGLGKALADVLAREHAQIVLSDLAGTTLNDAAHELNALAVPADVSKQKDVQALARTTVDRFGKIDLWINNAGIWMLHAPLLEQTSEQLHALMEVNFFGTLFGAQSAFAQMQQQKAGTIVNILSIRAKEPKVGTAGYAASKAAATAMTKTLRMEAEPFGIHVIGVFPSRMKTNLFGKHKHLQRNYHEHMEPIDVAKLIVANIKKDQPDNEMVIDTVRDDLNE